MKYKYIIVVGLILFLAGCQGSVELGKFTETGPPQVSEQRGSLVLDKEPLFNPGGGGSACNALYRPEAGKDVPDMRAFPYYACEGRYTLTLSGKKGTTLSLFGRFQYQKEGGFMVIVKNDDQKVWVINLDDIPSGKWLSVEAGSKTGGYGVFFRKASGFGQNISSVKWGQWWQGDPPE
jgi:hypothetical protein